ncbi:MAG: hypothetical protein H5T44_04200 [Thermoplasmatales archaeon]|nr:hypothetical protein [Thermoplasmatales archaeon]
MKKEIIICLMLVLASLNLAVADSKHTISIVPSSQTVNLNSSFSVRINITPASPVSSAACNISFNPSILRANSVTNGGMFETWLGNLTIVIDNTAGKISYIMAVSSTSKTQEGTFAIINFTAIGTGSSYINIENPIVHGTTDLIVVNGSVNVQTDLIPFLSYYPAYFDFNLLQNTTAESTFEIWNSGSGILYYNLSETCTWLSLNVTTGSSSGERDEIKITVNTTGLSAGNYVCNISINSNGGSGKIRVNLTVIPIDTTPPVVQVIYPNGGEILYVGTTENIRWIATDDYGVQSIAIYYSTNGGVTYNPIFIGTENDGIYEWLIPDTPSTNCKIKVVAYDYASNSGYDESNSTFEIRRFAPVLSYYPAYFDFNLLQNTTAESTFEIWNSGSGILYYNLSETCTWLSLNVTTGSSSGERDEIKITVNTTGLSAGNYVCNISINSNGGSGKIRVNLTVLWQDNIPPSISDVVATPPVQDAGKYVRISCIVTDNVNVSDVFLNITYPNLTHENFSIFSNRTGNTFFCNRTYSLIGNYSFFIYAIDSSNNSVNSSLYNFEIKDLSPPEIKNISYPSIASFGINMNISCIVTDNVNVSDVFLNITYPNLTHENFSIFSNRTGNTFFCNRTYSLIGNYSFFIYAIDSSNNSNISAFQNFEIRDITPPSIEIIAPAGGEFLSGNVTIRWSANDNYDGTNVKITIKYSPNGGGIWINVAVDEANDGSHTWNIAGLEDGSNYVIMIIATDSSHNSGSEISQNFTIDNTKPKVKIDKPEKGKMYIFDRGVIPIIGKPVIIGKITVEVTANDTYGIQKVEFYIDDVKKGEDFSFPYSWTCDEKLILVHKIKAIAYDKAGNKNEEEIEAIFFNPL